MKNWKETVVNSHSTIKDVMERFNKTGIPICLVAKEECLLGVVTDGDIRRGFLNNIQMDETVEKVMNKDPKTANPETSDYKIKLLLEEYRLRYIPIIDQARKIQGLKSLNDLNGSTRKENIIFLMAGGLGSRLKPLTDEKPKPLLMVGTKPILHNIIDNFIDGGFYRFYISVNYKSSMIKDYFGDGSQWGIEINYIEENKRLGTAGALSLLDPIKVSDPVIVMNADLLTKVNYQRLLDYHHERNSSATMCVREYKYQVPYGVIEASEYNLTKIIEKPTHLVFINAGIYVLNPDVISKVPKDTYFEMTSLLDVVKDESTASIFPIYEYWLDIGQLDDFNRAQKEYPQHFDSKVIDDE